MIPQEEKNDEQITPLGIHYHQESAKAYKRFLTFSFFLLAAHLLDIKPQKYQGFGLSADIKEQKIIFGLIATVVLYEFCLAFYYEIIGNSILFFDFSKQIKNKLIKKVRKESPNLSQEKVENRANIYTNLVMIVILPFMLAVIAIAILALVIATKDFYNFLLLIMQKYGSMLQIL